MKSKILCKIKCFLKSEEGRVGLKIPLALGVASGSLLVAQAVLSPSAYSSYECSSDSDCGIGKACEYVCEGMVINGKCYGSWVKKCVGS